MKSCKKVLILALFLGALFVSFCVTIKEGATTYNPPPLSELTGIVFFINPENVSPGLAFEVEKLKEKGPYVRVENCTSTSVRSDYDLTNCPCPCLAKLYKKGKYVKDYIGPMKTQNFMDVIKKMID